MRARGTRNKHPAAMGRTGTGWGMVSASTAHGITREAMGTTRGEGVDGALGTATHRLWSLTWT